jgi:hypothetical protein
MVRPASRAPERMDAFSYLSVLISIILGLGVTQLLTGIGRLIQGRHRVRHYPPAVIWAALLLLVHVQTWWSMFGMRHVREWTFLAFFVVLLQPVILYLLSALVLPDLNGPERVDLRRNYIDQSRWFFGLFVLLLVVSVLKEVVLDGTLPDPMNLAAHLVFLGFSVVALVTRSEAYHRGQAPVVVVAMLAYIAALFWRLS